ncbi:MAG: response regulator [Proteobacteria bacterium]|nr:response regulator [Pseudomonadota bacterium]
MRSTLRLRLLVMILLVLLPAAAIIAFDVFEARSRQVRDAEQQGRQLAQAIIGTMERTISHVEGMLDLLTQIPEIRDLSAPNCSGLLTNIAQSQPRYATIIAVDRTGMARCASNPKAVGVSAADRPWFKQALGAGSFTIGEYTIGRVSQRPILGFALPMIADGNATGVAYASIDLAWFGAHDAAQTLPKNASFTLIDQTGLVMARYPDGGAWAKKSVADTPLFAALKEAGGTGDRALTDLDGAESFFHLVKLQRGPNSAPIYLALGLHLEDSLAVINRNMAIKAAILLAIAGAVTLLSYFTSAQLISRPVEHMVRLSSRIAGGDLSVRSGLTHDESEFGRLAESLDSMAEELERHQQELDLQQRYMRAVLDNTAEMIFCFDNDGRLAFMNGAARALGLPEGALSYQELVAANESIFDARMTPLPYDQIPIVRVMNGETVINAEVVVQVHKDDPLITMLVNGKRISDEGGHSLGVVLAARDVTALRATESSLRQAQKMEAVGQLTGGVAHDFNNLLGVVIGNIDTLLPHLTQPGDIELANEAMNGALHGADLTRQMLAFARRQALNPASLQLDQHLPQLATMLRRTLGETITVTVHCAENLWPCFVDAGQLDSVLLNFAINSRDAMPKGGHLTIEASNATLDDQYAASNAEVAAGEYVRISVSDNGTGIPPEILNRVMEPFFTTKEPGKGTGLGLSMAFGFAKQSGGHLKIYSEVGHGTTINLYLPRGGSIKSAVSNDRMAAPAPEGVERILLVDDNEAVRKTAARQLRDLGYEVVEAESGPMALQQLQSGLHIDLLFSDIIMPGGLSGFDLATRAAELYPQLKVLLVTGFAEAAIRNANAPDQNIALMSKPYRRQELAERIRALLDNT